MKRITKFAKLAEQLEQAISAHVTEGKGAFPKDKAMKAVYRRDDRDLRNVLELFRKEDFAAAYALAWKLDSLPRELIPQAVWRVMARVRKPKKLR
jgi:hypothetical protein